MSGSSLTAILLNITKPNIIRIIDITVAKTGRLILMSVKNISYLLINFICALSLTFETPSITILSPGLRPETISTFP